ncbi:MAG: TIGR02147 family protein [Chitinivibrionales bacterium]|nr:TIGR02147 family protein [Chitinivibrionales bacterium]
MRPVFEYLDYRAYLRDFFAWKKEHNRHYSLQVLADRAGYRARDYLLRVMNGKKNLSEAGIAKVGKALQLASREQAYFENLVKFNQATEVHRQQKYFANLSSIRPRCKSQLLRRDQFEYLSGWHFGALRSLLPMHTGPANAAQLGACLDPPVGAREVGDALKVMERLGLVQRQPDGGYAVADQALSTGPELRSITLANLHKSLLKLAERSIDHHPAEQRDITGLTMSVSRQGYEKVKRIVAECRRSIIEAVLDDTGEDRVYQLNMHLFPLSRVPVPKVDK